MYKNNTKLKVFKSMKDTIKKLYTWLRLMIKCFKRYKKLRKLINNKK